MFSNSTGASTLPVDQRIPDASVHTIYGRDVNDFLQRDENRTRRMDVDPDDMAACYDPTQDYDGIDTAIDDD